MEYKKQRRLMEYKKQRSIIFHCGIKKTFFDEIIKSISSCKSEIFNIDGILNLEEPMIEELFKNLPISMKSLTFKSNKPLNRYIRLIRNKNMDLLHFISSAYRTNGLMEEDIKILNLFILVLTNKTSKLINSR